jgi:subtilase family serine protease
LRLVRARIRLAAATLPLVLLLGPSGASQAATRPITFYFGLARPEAAARAAFFAVEQPGSSSYRRFLSPARAAARYGASATIRARFLRAIRRHGFSARVDPSGVFARVTGAMTRFERVFGVRIVRGVGDGGVIGYGTRAVPTLPADLRPLVRDVVFSYLRQGSVGHTRQRPAAHAAASAGPRRTGSWTRGCAKAKRTGGFGYAQVRHAYGIDHLGTGAGAEVAILGLQEMPSGRDIADNEQCFGYAKLRSHTLLTDGQRPPITPGLFEPQEDLALVRGMAPAATLFFTQAWSGSASWFLGASQVLDEQRLPGSLSISYGICENDVRGTGPDVTPSTKAGANLLDSLMIRLGLAGVGTYASAGDSGSSCNGLPYSGVAWPASSPYVTSVGGTRLTLTGANRRRDEVVWNDLHWLSSSEGGGAGGGGFASKSLRGPYQRGLGLPGDRRAVPDVAAAASNFPGWPVALGGTWLIDGGTSAAAPLIASAMAVVSADLERRHLPAVGPANGLLYYLARHRPSAFWDVIHGNNRFFAKVPARVARRGYDLASGLGVPQFAEIARVMPSAAGQRVASRPAAAAPHPIGEQR